jgi:phosphatidylglycerophosphate synthase
LPKVPSQGDHLDEDSLEETALTTNSRVSRSSYRANLSALAGAQKSSAGIAAYGRYVNRPLGRRVAAATHLVGLTPNGASVVSAALSSLGLLLLALVKPSPWVAVSIAMLLAAGYVMDSVDGQLARLRGAGSLSGEWLDHTIDCFKTSILHLAVLVSWYRWPPLDDRQILIVPLAYEVVQVVTYFGLILMPVLRLKGTEGSQARASGIPEVVAPRPPESPWRTWLILPTDYGFLCWVFLLLAWPVIFFWAYTAMATLSAAMLALALRKWWHELRALDAERSAL